MAISTYRPASTVQAGQIRYNTPQQAQQAYNKVSSAQPGQMQTYNPAVQNGQKTNLSGLFGSIGQKPAQFYSMGQLQPLMDQQRTAGMSTLNGPRTFQLGDALSAMQRASQTGQAVAMPNQRFGTPEQMGQLIQQINGQLDPLAQQQQNAATQGFNQSMQGLRNKFASQGLIGSSALSSQQVQGANQLANKMADIKAEQQANAIPLALQFGQAGMQEDMNRFNMAANNRDFQYGQAQDYVQNLLAGGNQEQGQIQYKSGFEQNAAQNAVQNMQGALSLQEQQQQNYLQNLLNANQMQQQQDQWSQDFGQQGQKNAFDRWYQTQALNSQNQNNWQQNMINAAGQASDAQLQTNQLNQGAYEFGQNFGENQRQFNTQQAMQYAQLFGQGISPEQIASGNFGGQGTPMTLQARQSLASMLGYDPVSGKSTFENKMAKNQMALDLMKMFPQVPGGIEKLFGENAQFADLGGVLGGMTGQDTADTWAQKGTWQNQKDLQAMQNQGQLDAIYAQATAKASADRAQKANLAGVSKQVMDMLDAGNFNDAIDMLVTNGIDPEGFFKGVNGGQTLYPPTQMPTADEIGLSNKYGVSPQAAQLIGQLGKVGVGKEAVTSMIEQAKKDPSFQNLTSNDWAGIYDWANQTKANTLGVPTGGYRMGQYQGNPILDSIIRGQPVNQSGNGPVKGAQRRITPYGFPSVR